MVHKFSQQMKHAQRTEKYIRLIFNSYISDGDFLKVHAHYRHELFFFFDIFKAKRGCALCTNAHYTTLNTVYHGMNWMAKASCHVDNKFFERN